MDKCFETICVILSTYETEHFFNENDLDIVVDIGLRELSKKNCSRARVQILRTLAAVLDHPTYLHFHSERLKDYDRVISDQILEEDPDDEPYSPKER